LTRVGNKMNVSIRELEVGVILVKRRKLKEKIHDFDFYKTIQCYSIDSIAQVTASIFSLASVIQELGLCQRLQKKSSHFIAQRFYFSFVWLKSFDDTLRHDKILWQVPHLHKCPCRNASLATLVQRLVPLAFVHHGWERQPNDTAAFVAQRDNLLWTTVKVNKHNVRFGNIMNVKKTNVLV
jgi:hypothetical protein